MEVKIQTRAELKARIAVLNIRRGELENEFEQRSDKFMARVKYPAKLIQKFSDWLSSFSGYDDPTKKGSNDWVNNILKTGLPIIFTRYMFPQAGIVTKAVMAILSQQASKSVSTDIITDLFSKVKDWVSTPKNKKPRQPVLKDYGIPPDSETF